MDIVSFVWFGMYTYIYSFLSGIHTTSNITKGFD